MKPEPMTKSEAYRLARIALHEKHPMELAIVSGIGRMVPTERHGNGLAKRREDQEACDAYNFIADLPL